MIVLGNAEFAVGMKLAGIKKSYVVRKREDGLELLKKIDKEEFILANLSVIELLPELREFKNVAGIPDSGEEFGRVDDLKKIIKSVVGIELEVV